MQIVKVGLIVTLAIAILAAPLSAEAQQPGKVPRIGVLSPFSPGSESIRPAVEAFHQGLRDLGWIPGKNVTIDYRWAEEKYEQLPDLANELVRLKVDVIFAMSVPAILAAKRATSTVPIVFESLGDPVVIGLVASLARPGGNLTGLSGLAPELSGKRLQLLKEAVPGLTRVAVLANPSNPMAAPLLRETEVAARALGVRLQVLEVREPGKIAGAFAAMAGEQAEALVVLQDPLLFSQVKQILSLVAKRRLPAIYVESGWVPAGGLMSYAPSLTDQYRRAATYVDKILKGAKPADLPVEQPTRFELVINLKTAKALGLAIPQTILIRADQVLQ
jgi:putative ABC transport system substrate-binding protein